MKITERKGCIAVAKVKLRALEKDIAVSIPDAQLRYDLILDIDGKLYKAQIKYADFFHNGSVVVKTSTSYMTAHGSKQVKYEKGDLDLLLVYVPKKDEILCFPFDFFSGKAQFMVRYEKAKNGQTKGVINASDYIW